MAASSPKKSVLITGCSDGGLGAALAIEFHKAGLHVYATARNPLKMKEVQSHGIETLELDVLSEASIAACAAKVPSLDILLNNAGGLYSMPMSDIDLTEAKKLFDLNVWSYIAVTQAFLPLLLKSKGLIVHQTSSAGAANIPFQSVYNASKACMSMFSDTMRLELEPFDVRVVDLKTSLVTTNVFKNQTEKLDVKLPKGSIYEPARERVEKTLRGDFVVSEVTAEQFAKGMVPVLLKKNPPLTVWHGTKGTAAWLVTVLRPFLPTSLLDGVWKKMTGLDEVDRIIRKRQ